MLVTLLFFFGLLLFVGLSVRERARQQLLRATRSDIRPSPLSNALAYVVGVAGGIYLSLSLLIDFLGADIPNRITVWKLEMEPVAVLAIGLALLQPFLTRVLDYFRRGRLEL
ncbi:MAG: hypothetical protein AB1500_05155 [Bacillota bacterium]